MIALYIYLFLTCFFFSTNAMQKDNKSSLQKYYLNLQPQLKENFLTLPHEIQIHIATILYTPLHLWFEKQRFIHNNWVNSACFNNNETLILTASADKTAIWDIHTEKELQRFQHDKCVNSACFNKDETQILTASDNKTACIWDIKTRKELQCFKHNDWVRSARFNNNEKLILTASDDNTARIWDIHTEKELQRFQHDKWVNSACFNKNETRILTASTDKTARIWQRYTTWNLEQLLLCKLLFTWLKVQKTNKSVNSIKAFIKTTRIYDEIDSKNISQIIQSFPIPVQTALWQKIQLFIQRYGK